MKQFNGTLRCSDGEIITEEFVKRSDAYHVICQLSKALRLSVKGLEKLVLITDHESDRLNLTQACLALNHINQKSLQ